MIIGLIGLGRMGNAIGFRLVQAGHTVFGFDEDTHAQKEAQKIGIEVVKNREDLAYKTRVIWLMVPIDAVDTVIMQLVPSLKGGDIIIDGGNSFYKDSMRRAQELAARDIIFLDCGTSSGGGR